ncbi:hypothetical protein BDY17DRAFT_295526 [Neohortaea acidophila]|uniref:Cx9C motif-containing protein 4, mitochondrial n=1 Tax=Neohortaea acidophila TaxID=245834 RepID=A0A6A6PXB7_9PEZI|nr:uncharacterized protein BDY17DRAFT_295526 [Neohortaea acidophila]KAF2484374.1 hypothetical protein BDY17DRAFT_295526 [Neohortaea acidophila]
MPDIEKSLKHETPCHPLACALQDCVQKNNFDQSKCEKQIDELYECCRRFYERNGDEASVVSCPKASLLRLKMKQRSEGVK